MEAKVTKILKFLLNDQKIAYAFVNPIDLVLGKSGGYGETVEQMRLQEFTGSPLHQVFFEFFGLESIIRKNFHLASDLDEIYNLEPVARDFLYQQYFRFQLIRFDQGIVLLIYDVTKVYKKIHEISQDHHNAILLESELKTVKDKFNGLSENIFPKDVQIEYREGKHPKPRSQDNITLLFLRVSGLSDWRNSSDQERAYHFLNSIYSQFDKIAHRYSMDVWKISYHVYAGAGGFSSQAENHPFRVCLAALEMEQFIQGLDPMPDVSFSEPFSVQIVVHAGPVVSGIIGKQKISYDIWGHTAIAAEEMLAQCPSGQIFISDEVRRQIGDLLLLTEVNQVKLDNNTGYSMFRLVGIAPQFAAESTDSIANKDC